MKKLMPWKDKANQAAFRVEEGMVLSINLAIHHFLEGGSLQMLFLFLQSMVVSYNLANPIASPEKGVYLQSNPFLCSVYPP